MAQRDAIVTLEESERMPIRQALAVTAGRIHGPDGAAALLGINPSTLQSRMKKAVSRNSPRDHPRDRLATMSATSAWSVFRI